MKKLGFVRKYSRKSRLKKALLAGNHSIASSCMIANRQDENCGVVPEMRMFPVSIKNMRMEAFSFPKYGSFHSNLWIVRQMSEKNVKRLRRMGFKIQILGPTTGEGNQYARLIKALRFHADSIAVSKVVMSKSKDYHSRISRFSHKSSRVWGDRGGKGSSPQFGGHYSPSFGGGGGGPYNNNEERDMLVAILLEDGEMRKRLLTALEVLDRRDGRIHKRLNEIDNKVKIHEPQPKMIFDERIEEVQMIASLSDVYDKMLGNSAKRKNVHYDLKPVELMAYLFIVIARCHYGRYEFEKNGKQPFFNFFIEKVVPELYGKRGVTRKTMSNYVKPLADWLLLSDDERAKKPKPVQNGNRGIEKMYETVCGNFHNTKYGKWLASQVWK